MTDPDSGERTGLPRWLTLSVLVAALVAVVVVVVMLVSGGHNPPSHGPSDEDAPASRHVPPSGVHGNPE